MEKVIQILQNASTPKSTKLALISNLTKMGTHIRHAPLLQCLVVLAAERTPAHSSNNSLSNENGDSSSDFSMSETNDSENEDYDKENRDPDLAKSSSIPTEVALSAGKVIIEAAPDRDLARSLVQLVQCAPSFPESTSNSSKNQQILSMFVDCFCSNNPSPDTKYSKMKFMFNIITMILNKCEQNHVIFDEAEDFAKEWLIKNWFEEPLVDQYLHSINSVPLGEFTDNPKKNIQSNTEFHDPVVLSEAVTSALTHIERIPKTSISSDTTGNSRTKSTSKRNSKLKSLFVDAKKQKIEFECETESQALSESETQIEILEQECELEAESSPEHEPEQPDSEAESWSEVFEDELEDERFGHNGLEGVGKKVAQTEKNILRNSAQKLSGGTSTKGSQPKIQDSENSEKKGLKAKEQEFLEVEEISEEKRKSISLSFLEGSEYESVSDMEAFKAFCKRFVNYDNSEERFDDSESVSSKNTELNANEDKDINTPEKALQIVQTVEQLILLNSNDVTPWLLSLLRYRDTHIQHSAVKGLLSLVPDAHLVIALVSKLILDDSEILSEKNNPVNTQKNNENTTIKNYNNNKTQPSKFYNTSDFICLSLDALDECVSDLVVHVEVVKRTILTYQFKERWGILLKELDMIKNLKDAQRIEFLTAATNRVSSEKLLMTSLSVDVQKFLEGLITWIAVLGIVGRDETSISTLNNTTEERSEDFNEDEVSIAWKFLILSEDFSKIGKQLMRTVSLEKLRKGKFVKFHEKLIPNKFILEIQKLEDPNGRNRKTFIEELLDIKDSLKEALSNSDENSLKASKISTEIPDILQRGAMILSASLMNEISWVLHNFDGNPSDSKHLYLLLHSVKSYCGTVDTLKFPPEWEIMMTSLGVDVGESFRENVSSTTKKIRRKSGSWNRRNSAKEALQSFFRRESVSSLFSSMKAGPVASSINTTTTSTTITTITTTNSTLSTSTNFSEREADSTTTSTEITKPMSPKGIPIKTKNSSSQLNSAPKSSQSTPKSSLSISAQKSSQPNSTEKSHTTSSSKTSTPASPPLATKKSSKSILQTSPSSKPSGKLSRQSSLSKITQSAEQQLSSISSEPSLPLTQKTPTRKTTNHQRQGSLPPNLEKKSPVTKEKKKLRHQTPQPSQVSKYKHQKQNSKENITVEPNRRTREHSKANSSPVAWTKGDQSSDTDGTENKKERKELIKTTKPHLVKLTSVDKLRKKS